jgi:hypothetical protein
MRACDLLYICSSPECNAALHMHTVNAAFKALSPAARLELEDAFSFRGKTIYAYGKDMDRIKAAVAECKTAIKRELQYNRAVLDAAMLDPHRAKPLHRLMCQGSRIKLFPALHIAAYEGFAAVLASEQPLTTLTALTMENASEFVEQVSRVRVFTEMIHEYTIGARVPHESTFYPADSLASLSSCFIDIEGARFSIGIVLSLDNDATLRNYANWVARGHIEKYFDGVLTTMSWPWLAEALTPENAEVPAELIAAYVQRVGEAVVPPRAWTRKNHLASARQWAIPAVQQLLLVLYRNLGSRVADALLEPILSHL